MPLALLCLQVVGDTTALHKAVTLDLTDRIMLLTSRDPVKEGVWPVDYFS